MLVEMQLTDDDSRLHGQIDVCGNQRDNSSVHFRTPLHGLYLRPRSEFGTSLRSAFRCATMYIGAHATGPVSCTKAEKIRAQRFARGKHCLGEGEDLDSCFFSCCFGD